MNHTSLAARKLSACVVQSAFVVVLLSGGLVAAQTPAIPANATEAEIKKIKDDANLRKEALDALAGEAASAKALAAAKDTTKPANADQLAAAKAQKELADAQKAQADAEKARSDAAAAAAKAKYGDFAPSGQTGAVELATGAGNAEALLLASVAVRKIGAELAAALDARKPAGMTKALLFTSGSAPDFEASIAFDAQHAAFKRSRDDVTEATKNAPKRDPLALSVASVGLGLEAVSKVLSYFKSDYKIQGIDVTTTDGMLLAALAGELLGLKTPITPQVPELFDPAAVVTAQQALEDVSDAFQIAEQARQQTRQHTNAQSRDEKDLAEQQKVIADPKKSKADKDRASVRAKQLQEDIEKAKEAAALWKALADRVDAWMVKLTTADDKGQIPLAAVVRQASMRSDLRAGAALVIIQLHKAAGTGYTKKNLWSSLGANPFYVMGGAVATMTAFDGKTGDVFSSALVPIHGGYHSISDVRGIVNARPK